MDIHGGYIDKLEKAYISVDMKQYDKSTIEIPKYEGSYKYEYASNVE